MMASLLYICFFLVQVVLFQINIFFHQLTQNTTIELARFTKIYANCSEIQNTSFASFEFVQIFVNLTKQSSYFGVIGVQNMLIWRRITCSMKPSSAKYVGIMYLGMHLQFAQFINSYQNLQ